jgi:hypothetical protein
VQGRPLDLQSYRKQPSFSEMAMLFTNNFTCQNSILQGRKYTLGAICRCRRKMLQMNISTVGYLSSDKLPLPRITNTAPTAYFANSPFPLFHRPTFERRASKMYTDHPPSEKCFRASWNMILAFGSHYTGASHSDTPLEETEGWKHFTAAHNRLPDLLQGSNLSALQALLLIVGIV